MKRLALFGLVLFAVAATAGVIVARSQDRFDRWRMAAGGHDTTRLSTLRLADGRYEFRAYLDEDRVPNVVYFTPGQGGGVRLVAVGEHGGWAIEPRVIHVGDRDIVYGASIPEAARVRVRAGKGATTAVTMTLPGHAYRYFVLVTEPGGRVRSGHDIEALDSAGQLLGRGHDNDGTATAPDLGAYDGLWDREHVPPAK